MALAALHSPAGPVPPISYSVSIWEVVVTDISAVLQQCRSLVHNKRTAGQSAEQSHYCKIKGYLSAFLYNTHMYSTVHAVLRVGEFPVHLLDHLVKIQHVQIKKLPYSMPMLFSTPKNFWFF